MKPTWIIPLLVAWNVIWSAETIHAQDVGALAKQKPVKFSGGLNVTANLYKNVQGRERLDPFAWTVSGSPTLTLYGISVPFFS